MLALDSGCRRGELTGLKWQDVDFEKGSITINKATQYVAGYGTFEKSTKSDTSNRVIYIAPTTLQLLKKYKVEKVGELNYKDISDLNNLKSVADEYRDNPIKNVYDA